MKTQFIFLLSVLLLATACADKEKREIQTYDEATGQHEILTKKGIDSVLNSLDEITYADLDDDYLNFSDPDRKFEKQLRNKKYKVIRGRDVYKIIVGKYRINDFIAPDKYKIGNRDNLDANTKIYWLYDKDVLYMLLEFIEKLEEKGYDKYGFEVRESHRHPLCNKVRGGASKSQHINGKAIDLVIRDIDKSGHWDQEDKAICLDILEPLIGSRGGIGKYPGTQTIHIDSRGYAARWDSY
ncbi:D-Ala-D-Ala carboxypeptidase family metallohydrolase [Paracrocinitomix mangrovi]|uniref:D-Ala-D-Ala carboxypeptidase family metallohydrolase n=1 Tax=Paracrocinitomix mangrovi TaxID=2862509 RepID=UPI001C8E6CDE|nr:D-Ala-D-Ala carboxypeptidase family metallohydrolase [Paracrocinitomix mangrovi]UKN02932.1 D-Ala-D-Ala carboxypeptidase family metallohydrolase [Paracrocinitomix mangrovi]